MMWQLYFLLLLLRHFCCVVALAVWNETINCRCLQSNVNSNDLHVYSYRSAQRHCKTETSNKSWRLRMHWRDPVPFDVLVCYHWPLWNRHFSIFQKAIKHILIFAVGTDRLTRFCLPFIRSRLPLSRFSLASQRSVWEKKILWFSIWLLRFIQFFLCVHMWIGLFTWSSGV